MNSITRLILRRVVSGNVTLTPQVIKALKEFNEDHPAADQPANAGNESAPPPDEARRDTPVDDKGLTLVNPRSSWGIRRTSSPCS